MFVRKLLLVLASAISFATVAHAETLKFSFVGDATAGWRQSSTPMPNFTVDNGYTHVPVTDGITGVTPFGGLFAYVAGGFAISEGNFVLIEDGPAIFTGPVGHPVFSMGQIQMSNGILTATAVPEPSTWALLFVGFGGVGLMTRRSRTVALTAAA